MKMGAMSNKTGVDQHKAWSGYRPQSGDEMIEIYNDPAMREATITWLTTKRWLNTPRQTR